MQTATEIRGLILYEGPSLLDNEPIVVILTNIKRKVKNKKTGNMLQTWILRSDIDPCKAFLSGQDISVCGNCKHRELGTCYVTLFYAPWNVYQAYQRCESYTHVSKENMDIIKGRYIRIGSYGDPAAVPIHVWHDLCSIAKGWTGYTHGWKDCNPDLKKYCMASVDSLQEMKQAIRKGWRTFRVRCIDDEKEKGELTCPASVEAGKKLNCLQCLSCSGTSSKRKANVCIKAHGPVCKVRKLNKAMKGDV